MDLPVGLYRHYKGGLYQLLGVAAHSETKELMVVYVALYESPGPRMWVRPLKMWTEMVKWPDGDSHMRFRYIGNEVPKIPCA
jgi:hypothetical protein